MKKRLLTLAWLLCPLLFMAQAMADFTVYVKVNTTQKVNLYFWGVDGATTPSWPGKEMTKTTKHNYTTGVDDELYTYTISGTSATSINGIFNLGGGSPQTANLTLVNEGVYEWNGNDRASATNITGDYTNTASTYKVYFEDPGWDEVYAYPFSNDAAVDEAWPGKEINKNGAGKYEYSYTATSAPDYIIFNNGSNRQTPDLTFVDGKTYTHVYTVVGSSTALFTGAWTPDMPVNDMTANSDGTYTWTKEGVELSENVAFKVTYGHDGWNLNYGAGCTVNGEDATISITETATYDVTITLDLANNSLTGVATKQGGTEQNATITSVQYAGDDNSWTGADFTADATAANKYTYELDLSSNTENIGFKFLPNGNWLGYGNVTLDAPTGWITDSGEPNHNFVLNNASTGYQKYLITATWEENPSATEGWKLKVEGTEERQPVADTYTYYVVGDETLTGVAWDKDDANKFIENEGAYTLTKEGVVINKGEYSYKVVAVNNNTGAWTWMPEGKNNDDIVNIPSNGKYNITWTLNIDDIGTTDYPYSYELEEVDMVYSVVGASPGVFYPNGDPIFGHAWMSNETNNDMTLDDTATVPTYTWKKENVELNAGNIEMKVIKNHLYGDQGGAEWPSQNKVLAVEAGTYNIAISFVPSTGEVTITAEPVSQEEKDKYVYYVDMQNWTPSAHIWNNDGALTPDWTQGVADHTLNAFGNEYSVSKYEFAGEPTNIMFMGADDSQKTSDMPFVNGATYGNDGDAANGVFIFSDDENQFKPEQNVNVNGNAKYVRQFTVGEPCTVVLPFALGADKVGDNAEAGQVGVFYRITAIAEGQINGNTEVPGAYTPYVFIPAVEYPFTYVGFGQLPAVPETKNYALNGGDVVFEWVTTATTVTSDNEWTYYGWDKSTHKFVKAAVGQANPFRSYIKIKTDKLGSMGLSAKESIDLSFINGGEATAISALRAAIADGEATVFDLQGRKVDNPTMRGVYIVNGKKYVVK